MLVGPVLARELVTAPRDWRLYFVRALYVAALFALAVTAWLILIGSQPIRTLGDLSRFGAAAFALLAPVQLALATAFSALLTAAAVAQEKDRRTLDLLLMTNMTNSELVLGRLLASIWAVMGLVVAGAPLLMLLVLLGGVAPAQVARVTGVTLAASFAAGSLGSTLALWREKTFQTLAMTALGLVLWLLLGEALANGSATGAGTEREGAWAAAASPLRAILAAAEPQAEAEPLVAEIPWLGGAAAWFMLLSSAGGALLNGLAIWQIRVWNPSREVQQAPAAGGAVASGDRVDVHAAPGRAREVWDNPILWREVCTWAYGKKIVLVRAAYLALAAACIAAVAGIATQPAATVGAALPPLVRPLVPLVVVGLLLVNALAVTSLTNERDLRALDLLLVTDLTPKEIVFGKLAGIFYNSKEMILTPLAICGVLWSVGRLGGEELLLLILGQLVMASFAAMLGVHCGMMYANSRTAVGVSLGTVLFLLLGIAVCMRMLVAFQTSFGKQLYAFAAFIVGGSVGLYCAIGARRESTAIKWASSIAPLSTFFVLTSFLKGNYGAAALVTALAYGFATASLLVPAVFEFDVATGRTAARDL